MMDRPGTGLDGDRADAHAQRDATLLLRALGIREDAVSPAAVAANIALLDAHWATVRGAAADR